MSLEENLAKIKQQGDANRARQQATSNAERAKVEEFCTGFQKLRASVIEPQFEKTKTFLLRNNHGAMI